MLFVLVNCVFVAKQKVSFIRYVGVQVVYSPFLKDSSDSGQKKKGKKRKKKKREKDKANVSDSDDSSEDDNRRRRLDERFVHLNR